MSYIIEYREKKNCLLNKNLKYYFTSLQLGNRRNMTLAYTTHSDISYKQYMQRVMYYSILLWVTPVPQLPLNDFHIAEES